MAATNEYSCMIWLHMLTDYRNVLTVNFARGQKVVLAGWLLSADGLEISLGHIGSLCRSHIFKLPLFLIIYMANDQPFYAKLVGTM